jgi:predicted metal-dependent hydrolase
MVNLPLSLQRFWRRRVAKIQVRRMTFSYPENLPVHWHPEKPEWSQVVNASSLLMPYLEPYLCQAIRDALPHITDPALQEEAKGYIGQEAQHHMQHRRFNEIFLAKNESYKVLREYEAVLEKDYLELRRTRDLKFHLAYAAGFETMALAVAHMLINGRSFYFRGADPVVSSLIIWHFVEELEHKHAAYDVYQHVVGNYFLRIYGLAYAIWHTFSHTRRAYGVLLRKDGLWRNWKSQLRLKLLISRILLTSFPLILKSLVPWHNPGTVVDPDWARDWVELFDKRLGQLDHLDTQRIDLMPSQTI